MHCSEYHPTRTRLSQVLAVIVLSAGLFLPPGANARCVSRPDTHQPSNDGVLLLLASPLIGMFEPNRLDCLISENGGLSFRSGGDGRARDQRSVAPVSSP